MNSPLPILEEKKFFDNWAKKVEVKDISIKDSFEGKFSPENRYIKEHLGILKNKKILDLGCGFGEASIYFASKGAKVSAVDISEKMLGIVTKLARKNLVKVKTVCAEAEKLPFADGSFDIVYAANLLHHSSIEIVIKEAKRVLKKGGLWVSWDPLSYNPIINFYRKIAVKSRTKHEHPLNWNEVEEIKGQFSEVKIKTTWLLSLWIFIKFYLMGFDPNKVKYWKKVVVESERWQNEYLYFEKIDQFILKKMPFLRKYCWNVVIIGKNEK